MRFKCYCGKIIRDTSDFLSYKADFLASQDEEDFVDGMEEIIMDESLSKEKRVDKLMSLYTHYAWRSMYQCTGCERIFLENYAGELHCFAPEEHDNKCLLTSIEGKTWEGFLWASWKDVKPDWSEHNGYIDIETNESYDSQVFDDMQALLKSYYELFDELKQKNLIRSA